MSDTTSPAPGRATLFVLLAASTLGIMSSTILMPVIELMRADLGIGSTAAGLVLTVNGLTVALAGPLTGLLVDRLGVRTPLVGGLFLYALAGAVGLVSDSYALILASRIVFGLGAATAFTAMTVAMLHLYRGPERDRVMGWRTSATGLGGVLWPILGGALGAISWQAPFAVYLLGLPVGVAALLVLPADRPASRAGGGPSFLRILGGTPGLIGVYALMGMYMVLTYGLLVFLPQRLAELGVHSPFAVSLNVAVVTASSTLLGLAYARLRTRLSYDVLLRTVAVLWTAAFVVLGTTASVPALVAASVLLGAGGGVWVTALTVLIGAMAPPRVLGRATALSGTVGFAAQFLSPLLLGPLIDATSITTGFLALAAVIGAIAVALPFVRFPEAADRGRPAAEAERTPVE